MQASKRGLRCGIRPPVRHSPSRGAMACRRATGVSGLLIGFMHVSQWQANKPSCKRANGASRLLVPSWAAKGQQTRTAQMAPCVRVHACASSLPWVLPRGHRHAPVGWVAAGACDPSSPLSLSPPLHFSPLPWSVLVGLPSSPLSLSSSHLFPPRAPLVSSLTPGDETGSIRFLPPSLLSSSLPWSPLAPRAPLIPWPAFLSSLGLLSDIRPLSYLLCPSDLF